MTNPFAKRATEYLRDDSAFLSVVTPEPLHTFFEKYAKEGSLYDRLCMVVGTPGSGKTTIATMLQFRTVHTLINSPHYTDYRPLLNALSKCKIVEGKDIPIVLGCRLPMESEYRDLWELPYAEDVKLGLLKSFLQSRAIISWMNALKETGDYDLKGTRVSYREGAEVANASIGGDNAEGVLTKAKEIERVIYDINAALVPLNENQLPSESIAPYHPFDSIEEVIAVKKGTGEHITLRPLVILDDVHALHPNQLFLIRDWLSKREMRISRWMMMRLDAQTPEAVLQEGFASGDGIDSETTIQKSRDITRIWLQSSDDRREYRKKFRKMARSMADKYLRLMPVFSRQGLSHFQNLLEIQPKPISESNLEKLLKRIASFQIRSNISDKIRRTLEEEIDRYFKGAENPDAAQDVKLAMLQILLHRYVVRVPQASLFDGVSEEDAPEPAKPLKADSDVADGARLFLFHEYNRPYYYGIDAVCDGSSENAEQFLHLAGHLVNAAEARIIRGTQPSLPSYYQDRLLRNRAEEIIRDWAFPKHHEVRQICAHIAQQCVEKTLEPNAPLGGGANAFGVPQEEFDCIVREHPDLGHVLKYGVAYNALSIKSHHKTKNRRWTLVELTGPFLIDSGLTFTRGGFLEKRVKDLLEPITGGMK